MSSALILQPLHVGSWGGLREPGEHPPKLPPVPAALGVHIRDHNKLKQETPK